MTTTRPPPRGPTGRPADDAAAAAASRSGRRRSRCDVPAATVRPGRAPALPRAVVAWHAPRSARRATELADAGMATAEYAIATLAAVGFAGLLVVILKGNEVKGLLLGIVRQALSL